MKWYAQNCAIKFGKTLSSTIELFYKYMVFIKYVPSKDLSTDVPIVLALKNVISWMK